MIITNGECFNEIFQRKTGLNSFSFNEAFMIGKVNEHLFTDDFISLRVSSLNTTLDIYHQKIDDIIQELSLNSNIPPFSLISKICNTRGTFVPVLSI